MSGGAARPSIVDPITEHIEGQKQYAQLMGEVGEHRVEIRHDHDLYRHISFGRPGSSLYRFDIITWPGHLAIGGDLESFTFRRENDMLPWFEGHAWKINPGYWAEKLIASARPAREYSPDRFKAVVLEHFNRLDFPLGKFRTRPQLLTILERDVFDAADEEHAAHEALRDFAQDFGVFQDSWDWGPFEDFSHHFLLSCHAIVWGIAQYRLAKTAEAVLSA